MIIEYLRPTSIDEAVQYLSRRNPPTYPLGGGTFLNQQKGEEFSVVDLQTLGLDSVEENADAWSIGATTTLQELLSCNIYPALKEAIRHEATYNIRQIATFAGTLIAGGGRSPLVTVMLALAAQIHCYPKDEVFPYGDLVPLQHERIQGKLITHITISANLKLAYQYVARTPADLPIVCASVAQWPSGRTRVALGGHGAAPLLVFDGPSEAGAIFAARDAYEEAGDSWASALYRSDIAALLVKRCLKEIKS